MKILVADDDPMSRMILETALKQSGYEVQTASDGDEAWKAMQAEDAPQMAVLDWAMPGMSGVQICRQARSLREYMYIILISARNQQVDIIIGLEAGADDYITKPFDPHELEIRVKAGQRVVYLQAQLRNCRRSLETAEKRIARLQRDMRTLKGQ